MSKYFPSSINVQGRDCWVVGNDREAWEKAGRLVEAGAIVTVVAPEFSSEALSHFQKWSLTLLTRSFELNDIQNQFFIVLSAKDNPTWCEQVYSVCREKRVLLCAIDQPRYCDVVNVSFFKRGHLTMTISSDGAAPAVSRKIRLGLESSLKDVPLDEYLLKLADLRHHLEKTEKNPDVRREKLIAATDGFVFRAQVELPKK